MPWQITTNCLPTFSPPTPTVSQSQASPTTTASHDVAKEDAVLFVSPMVWWPYPLTPMTSSFSWDKQHLLLEQDLLLQRLHMHDLRALLTITNAKHCVRVHAFLINQIPALFFSFRQVRDVNCAAQVKIKGKIWAIWADPCGIHFIITPSFSLIRCLISPWAVTKFYDSLGQWLSIFCPLLNPTFRKLK